MRMVALGEPERAALDTLWNLGFLTAGQFSRFRGRCTRRWAEEVLSNLHRRSIVERTRRAPSWEPPSRGPRPYVYYLGERGVALAGRLHGGLTPGRARKAYRGVCREDLLDHALLRNEYAAEVAVAAWGHKGGLVVDGVYGERDAGRYTYPSQEKSPGCRPDAAIVVSDEVSYERKLVILVEAHIGTQDSTRVMSRKVNGYCKRGGGDRQPGTRRGTRSSQDVRGVRQPHRPPRGPSLEAGQRRREAEDAGLRGTQEILARTRGSGGTVPVHGPGVCEGPGRVRARLHAAWQHHRLPLAHITDDRGRAALARLGRRALMTFTRGLILVSVASW